MTNVNKHGVDYSAIEIGDLVKLDMRGEGTVLGYVTYVDSHMIKAIWSDDFTEWKEGFSRGNIYGHWKVVVHEPQEKLSESQESANFSYAAVQGIINAHAIKLEEDILKEMDMSGKFTFDDFDLSVRRTWKKQNFKDAVSNAALGLTGEAGEVADLVKKGVYHGRGFTPENAIPDSGEIAPDDVKDELSDVLFYVSAMAQEFGFTLEDIAKHNREKLEKRFPEGFSTEASAQKKDKHGRKFPFKAKVVGDRDGNPTGMRHGLDYGRIVTVTGEIFGNCYKADGLTIFKDDLKEVTN